MDLSRRTFLCGAAAAPAAAIAAGTAMATSAGAATQIVGAVTALEPLEFPFRYWVGDGERFGGDFDTLEAAMDFALREQSPVALRARQFEVDWHVDERAVEAMIEHMHEHVADEYGDPDGDGEDPSLDYTTEQRDELVREVKATFDAWRARHNLRSVAWQFDREGQERHDVPIPPVPTITIRGEEG